MVYNNSGISKETHTIFQETLSSPRTHTIFQEMTRMPRTDTYFPGDPYASNVFFRMVPPSNRYSIDRSRWMLSPEAATETIFQNLFFFSTQEQPYNFPGASIFSSHLFYLVLEHMLFSRRSLCLEQIGIFFQEVHRCVDRVDHKKIKFSLKKTYNADLTEALITRIFHYRFPCIIFYLALHSPKIYSKLYAKKLSPRVTINFHASNQNKQEVK